jgi:mannose-6-phosphate isomerase-like protein (cupin superfamily)
MAIHPVKQTTRTGSARRIVTGYSKGKSVILDDAEVTAQDLLGAKVIELWETVGTPTLPIEGEPHKKQLAFKMPDPGGTRLRLVIIPPDQGNTTQTEEHNADASNCDAKLPTDDSRMHRTRTVDYDIILSGELWMELDDRVEVCLKPGDCVIQNGTRHAWRNRSSQTCTMLAMCIGARRLG